MKKLSFFAKIKTTQEGIVFIGFLIKVNEYARNNYQYYKLGGTYLK